jgi:hypothetical protein
VFSPNTRADLLAALVVAAAVAANVAGLVGAVQHSDWPDTAGYVAVLTVVFFFIRWWQRERQAWWHSPEFRARHAEFVSRLTSLTNDGPYHARHAGTRQWIDVTEGAAPLPGIRRGNRTHFEVVVEDDPEPSPASGDDTGFDYITRRCFLVFSRNPRIDILVRSALVDPRTGDEHPVTDGRVGSNWRALVRWARTPAAARLAGSRDIDSLLELLDTAEPRSLD